MSSGVDSKPVTVNVDELIFQFFDDGSVRFTTYVYADACETAPWSVFANGDEWAYIKRMPNPKDSSRFLWFLTLVESPASDPSGRRSSSYHFSKLSSQVIDRAEIAYQEYLKRLIER